MNSYLYLKKSSSLNTNGYPSALSAFKSTIANALHHNTKISKKYFEIHFTNLFYSQSYFLKRLYVCDYPVLNPFWNLMPFGTEASLKSLFKISNICCFESLDRKLNWVTTFVIFVPHNRNDIVITIYEKI